MKTIDWSGSVTVRSAVLWGLRSIPVNIELFIQENPRETAFLVYGIAATAARELALRVRLALEGSGYQLPRHLDVRVTATDPATAGLELPTGQGLEFAIALALLTGPASLSDMLTVGSLASDGRLQPLPGLFAHLKQTALSRALVSSVEYQALAGLVGLRRDLELFVYQPVRLMDRGTASLYSPLQDVAVAPKSPETPPHEGTLVVGEGAMKYVRDHAALFGEPTFHEKREIFEIANAAGLSRDFVSTKRPFRAPHYTTSALALIGDDRRIGEVTLAHHGSFVLHEVHEFPLGCLVALRNTLRARTIYSKPAQPHWLVATMRTWRDVERIKPIRELLPRVIDLTASKIYSPEI